MTVRVDLPPLRERGGDVLKLAAYFLDKFAQVEHRSFLRQGHSIFLLGRYERVSCERVVSGSFGFRNLYEFLSSSGRVTVPGGRPTLLFQEAALLPWRTRRHPVEL
mgnify:CR=1 FL=1